MHENFERVWTNTFEGKTIKSIRPRHRDGGAPTVDLSFTDGSAFEIAILDGVYFEGCLINTLRRAQPVLSVLVWRVDYHWTITFESATFPLIMLEASNRQRNSTDFPFVVTEVHHG
jgi:hypothetical protein